MIEGELIMFVMLNVKEGAIKWDKKFFKEKRIKFKDR